MSKKNEKNPAEAEVKLSKKAQRKLEEQAAAKKAEKKKAKKPAEPEAAPAGLFTEPLEGKTLAEQDAEMKARIQKRRADRAAQDGRVEAMQHDTAVALGHPTPEEAAATRAEAAAKLTLADVTPAPVEAPRADAEAAHEADEVAPEVSTPVDSAVDSAPIEFAKPSEAPLTDFEENGLGQYKVKRPSDGKMVGYTRTTTYISVLEDTTNLTKWKMRILLEGVAAMEEPNADGKSDPVTAQVRDLVHNRDVTIAKARKADRKGKLHPGQLGTIVDGAWGDFKRALNKLADEVFEVGGGRVAATKGTDIHALCDIHDAEGIDAVQAKLDAGEITPADFADVEAYAAACKAMGFEVVAAEQVIVNDELKVAGRLDRIFLAKLPEIRHPKTGEVLRPADTMRKRYVGDLKTGNIEYSAGKIAQQIRMYAESDAYDLNTHERTKHRANRSAGIVIHLPAGSGKATVHLVDLTVGAAGNKLAGEVRAFRNVGRKAINMTDLVELNAAAKAAAEEVN